MPTCPTCGSDELYVIRATVYMSSRLESDGFLIENAETDNELVHCDGCDADFGLEDVIEVA